ncbi:hypothetical protein DE146DRAFT_667892 [Phaeosphaeria sp. MPI-PUGE-AT-0046c]|nr:hypothetical protein DE146DRAFT_667892 [Phaeosphaeria sp. MPI-PUGE-AT-0046c]
MSEESIIFNCALCVITEAQSPFASTVVLHSLKMTYPTTYRSWRRSTTPYPRTLVLSNDSLPKTLNAKDVLIRIHAVALNYRDHAMLEEGKYPLPVEDGGVSSSDCAAEVIAVGSEVKKFSLGDHVAPTSDLWSITGDERIMDDFVLGGLGPGTLREYAIFEEEVLVKLPGYLSWEEAATLGGAGVTAWKVLDGLHRVPSNATALLQGTGGVSVMTVLLCIAAGITPIITSSSDEKLARVLHIDPSVKGINYRTSDVKDEVLKHTDGKGVDFILNNIGISSIPLDLDLVRKSGIIAMVGFLEGFTADFSPNILMTILLKACRMQGIRAFSRVDFENLCAFLEAKKIKMEPVIDKVFSFDEAPEAFKYLASGKHIGKIVVKIP